MEETTTNKYNITLPNGTKVVRELAQDEAEYWISIAMYLAHGFQLLTMLFQSERMDDEATVEMPDDEVSVQ